MKDSLIDVEPKFRDQPVEIMSEDFEITESIRAQVDESAAEIYEKYPDTQIFHVSLKKIGPQSFGAIFVLRALRHDIIGQDEGSDLYLSIRKAKKHALRQLQKTFQRRRESKHLRLSLMRDVLSS